MARTQRITSDEIQVAFNDDATRSAFPPILSPEQFAQLLGVGRSTVYLWISQGRIDSAVTKIGKHQLIWRNRAIEIIFNKNKPKSPERSSSKSGDTKNVIDDN
jgi:excisionase family DNA binding protein